MNNSDSKRLHEYAKTVLTSAEVADMEHCIGWNRRKTYCRNGMRYFKPYRNHFDPGGSDIPIWEGLFEKGYADRSKKMDLYGGRMYWLNRSGLNILSAYKEVFIYSDNANGNEIDASRDVLDILLDDAVYCGYGCWVPSSSKDIALRARLPHKLALSTLRYLQSEGYAKHVYEGGCDSDGYPHCTHGWILGKKWIDEHQTEYKAAQIAEYKRIDAMLSEEDRDA